MGKDAALFDSSLAECEIDFLNVDDVNILNVHSVIKDEIISFRFFVLLCEVAKKTQ